MKTFLALVIVLALSLGVISSMSAQIPRTLSYQGVLTDTSGTPKPDGRYYFTFKLYDSGGPTGWSQAESLDVKRGLFYTTLGKEPNPFPSSLRFDRPYWLGIQVGSQPELPQRIPLTSVGYSLNSFRADSSSWSRRSDTASYAQSPARPISPPISTPEIANAAVDSTKLAANSVTSAKILDGTIQRVDVSPSFKAPAADTSDFARNVVIAVGSIDSTKLATNSVTSSKILDGTILNADISANAAISQSKIDNSVRAINADKVDGFDASATPTANMLLPLDNTAKFPVSALPSAGGDVSGSLNSLTVTGLRGTGVSPSTPLINQVLQYNGSQWVPASISVGGITSINSQTGPSISITSGSGISISTPTTNNIQISNTGVSSVTASPPLNSSGGTNPSISLSTFYGDNYIQNSSISASKLSFTPGTVTSVGTGSGLTGGPITGSGTISIATGGVTSTMIQDGTITGTDIASSTISGTNVVKPFTVLNGSIQGTIGGNSNGVYGYSPSASAIYGETGGTGSPLATAGVYGESFLSNGNGVIGRANNGTSAYGVWGYASSGYGVYGQGGSYGVYGNNTGSSGAGVQGVASGGNGVDGRSTTGAGVFGSSSSSGGFGVFGYNINGGTGIQGSNGGSNTNGYAGYFNGRVNVAGNFTATNKSFKIDHPLDPANKYLYHSCIESPDMKNMYDGIVVLDSQGEAIVELPNYFEALNRDFRYQLTSIGVYAPVYIAEEIVGNRFKIAGGQPGQKISWQVTGTRKDAFAEKYRIPTEEEKIGEERGRYLHPEAFGFPRDMGITFTREARLRDELKLLEQQPKPDLEKKQ